MIDCSRLYDKAIGDFTAAIRLDPNNAAYYYNRGEVYCSLGIAGWKKEDFDKAIADFTAAIRIDPDFAEFYFSRGIAYWFKDDYDQAISDLTEASRLDPANQTYRDNLRDMKKFH